MIIYLTMELAAVVIYISTEKIMFGNHHYIYNMQLQVVVIYIMIVTIYITSTDECVIVHSCCSCYIYKIMSESLLYI